MRLDSYILQLASPRGAWSITVLHNGLTRCTPCRRATSLDRHIAALALPLREELSFRERQRAILSTTANNNTPPSGILATWVRLAATPITCVVS